MTDDALSSAEEAGMTDDALSSAEEAGMTDDALSSAEEASMTGPLATSNLLEERYRRVLRLLPAWYRAVWEEDMVAALLESVETGDPEDADYIAAYGRPSWPEVASVVGLAVRLRFGAGPIAPPRAHAWGAAVRLFALMGLLTNAVGAIQGLSVLWWYGGVGLWFDPAGMAFVVGSRIAAFGWVLAFLAVLWGRHRLAWIMAAIAVASAVANAVSYTVVYIGGEPRPLGTVAINLVVEVLILLALSAFHRDAPPVRPRPWLVALPVGSVLVIATSLTYLVTPVAFLIDWPGLGCLALAAAAGVHLAAPAFGRARPSSWSLALTIAGTALLAERLISLMDYAMGPDFPYRWALLAFGAGQAALLIAVGVPVARLAARALRALPGEATADRTGAGEPGAP